MKPVNLCENYVFFVNSRKKWRRYLLFLLSESFVPLVVLELVLGHRVVHLRLVQLLLRLRYLDRDRDSGTAPTLSQIPRQRQR